jgi:hypothetical protein
MRCAQKNVRRGRVHEAMRTAFALLRHSRADALRRAPIIAIEDAVAHPLLAAAVWLMMAEAKGYELCCDHEALYLRLVHDCAAANVRDEPDWGGAFRSSVVLGLYTQQRMLDDHMPRWRGA